MNENPPKGPYKKGEVIHFDFEAKKKKSPPPEDSLPRYPEITIEEARKIYQDIYDSFEPKVWKLHGLVKVAREKFDAFDHLVSSGQYSEEHYRTFVDQQRSHRLGSKMGRKKEVARIFTEEERLFYEKIHGYEREFKDYVDNFLSARENLDAELFKAHSHLENVKGAQDLAKKLKEYMEKVDFDFASFIFIRNNPSGYRERIESLEKFTEKLIN